MGVQGHASPPSAFYPAQCTTVSHSRLYTHEIQDIFHVPIYLCTEVN